MVAYFITATGTDCGKTLVTAALCWQLRLNNHRVRCIKPVMTGVDGQNWKQSDAAVLMQAMENPVDAMALKQVSPWRFTDPVSPHLAARKAGIELDMEEIVRFCDTAISEDTSCITLVEGAGGVMTPITNRFTMLDLMQELALPVILLCGTYVGALSHTLSAISVLRERGVVIQAVVVNEDVESATSLSETAASLSEFGGLNLPVYTVPRLPADSELWKELPNLTEMIGL